MSNSQREFTCSQLDLQVEARSRVFVILKNCILKIRHVDHIVHCNF